MDLLQAWVLFPLVLAALSLGCGLLVERASGMRLPGVLVLPVGFAATVVAADLVTSISAIARFAVGVVVALALVGFALGLPDRRRPDWWATGAALLVFGVYAAPVVLSGTATFAGYIKLDDTSTWIAFTDHVLAHGRSLNLPPSTYQQALNEYIRQTGYPVGSVLPLGIGARLSGIDALWVYQPYLAFQALLLALALYGLLAGLVRPAWMRALPAFVAAQATLLYGYALWGSVKELVTVGLIALLVALVVTTVRPDAPARSVVAPAVAGAALLASLNVGGGVWLGLALVPALFLARRLSLRGFALRAGIFAGTLVVLALPALVTASSFFHTASHSLSNLSEDKYGNLDHRLSYLQVVGIWPVGDFRVRPHDMAPTYVLIAVAVAAATLGLLLAFRARRWMLPAYVGVSLGGALVLMSFGSPWVDAKVLATASPALLLAGMAGAALVFVRGHRVEAGLVAAALVFGVGWSNVQAYQSAWLAPRDQLRELETIGKRFAGQGPALINEYQPYGGRHLLRRLDPDSSGELRARLDLLHGGALVPKGGYADIDDFQLSSVLPYKTLVLPHSPLESRPPSIYAPVWQGRFYDVWQRPDDTTGILAHLPLGHGGNPVSAVPSCADVLRLATLAVRNGGRLAYVSRPDPVAIALNNEPHPAAWGPPDSSPYPIHSGTTSFPVTLAGGPWSVWIGGSFSGGLRILVDGQPVGARRHRLEHPGQYVQFGTVTLSPGRHKVELRYSGSDWHPGSAALAPEPLEQLVFARTTENVPVSTIASGRARELCGRPLDWVEAVS